MAAALGITAYTSWWRCNGTLIRIRKNHISSFFGSYVSTAELPTVHGALQSDTEVRTHPMVAPRREFEHLIPWRAVFLEELLRVVALHPGFEHLEMGRIG